ncbi:Crp/Fnr family transcriptional regulator [Jhaorihella thermophila]|uniref:Crp/Fnr family transcriptional regulator n=1 Tax=Jhaorihella thermophila TaxID=488547 RepID=UPI000CDEA758|nr:Crp/Fnr family transcriptional regulator [Jhaorihella thermophila]
MKSLDESLLAPLAPFRRLDRRQIREILDHAQPLRTERGHDVFTQGDEAARFFLLLDGYIRVERLTAEGDRVVQLHIPPGQLFGIARALGRDTYPASAVAAADCVMLWWPASLWDAFEARYPGFSAEVHRTVGQRFEEINSRVMELATQQVEQRVASALLRLSRQSGRQTDSGVEIAFPITRKIISEMTGGTLHSVSRLLAAWEKARIVESRHRHISVRDPARLEALSRTGGGAQA